ncbi:M56 family metallopeptidase [Skermania piniformis]|uniref:M56 family metallopeptidase n=1 Tax=Skermania pinensis TaxID=39122 RepID=A0ABX8S5L9_9ACTN|nr:M56 family metallopeptidase [Skermania piniformis]QXQ12447.1 M56 family metallopeptidase [Skermania piniformis]
MNAAAPVFAALALLLAGPIPAVLAKATWTARVPRAALVLWQAIALAAVLAAFGSGLAIASRLLVVGPDGRPTAEPLREIDALGMPLWLCYVAVLMLTLLIGARLMFAVVRVAIRTRRRRARHRMLVDLLDHSEHGRDSISAGNIRVLDTPEPIAYCVPGRRGRVVLSAGTLDRLADGEIRAILGHERAHLRARHDLVLEAFTAVHEAFPRVVRSESALDSVRLLVELLADDAAVRVSGPRPLARALVACAGARTPQGALAAGGPTTLVRIRRLSGPTHGGRGLAAAVYLSAAAILVVPTLAVALPWLAELNRLFRI